MTTRDWTPRNRANGVYCAPACGYGCKRSAFDKATAKADALAKSLGPEWRPIVWENLGWHWRVERGALEVWPKRRGSKTQWINLNGIGRNLGHRQYRVDAESPRAGFKTILSEMIAERDAINASIALIEDQFAPKRRGKK